MGRATVSGVIESDFLRTTREAYDSAAEAYAELFSDSLRESPLERAVLSAFAEIVQTDGDRPVADLGCGPGYVTAHLHGLGLRAFGIDLSPTMIDLARKAHPDLRFDVGTMTALDIPDGTLGGILSRFSLIHTPPAVMPEILAEFHRVLGPGGRLLLGFAGSEGPAHPTQSYDHQVALAYRWWPDHLVGLLREAGLTETNRLIREPEPADRRQFQSIQILARKA